jgi:DNA-binding response OmpR family regulator
MKTIVVAEDDADILFILDLILSDAGYRVESKCDGRAVVADARSVPDLFILDKEMPHLDGISVAKQLRANERTRETPIIMISAHHHLASKAREAGVNDFLGKPFELKDLLMMVKKYINLESSNLYRDLG